VKLAEHGLFCGASAANAAQCSYGVGDQTMQDVNEYLWQAEIFFSMSTKVADPGLAASLQNVAQNYLSKAVQLHSHRAPLQPREMPAY
jgi:hypothetical protein